jgi:hypothetical protein
MKRIDELRARTTELGVILRVDYANSHVSIDAPRSRVFTSTGLHYIDKHFGPEEPFPSEASAAEFLLENLRDGLAWCADDSCEICEQDNVCEEDEEELITTLSDVAQRSQLHALHDIPLRRRTKNAASNKIREQFNWRQDTPVAQLVVIRQSIWGTLDNMMDGATDHRVGVERINTHARELQYLVPYLLSESWEEGPHNPACSCPVCLDEGNVTGMRLLGFDKNNEAELQVEVDGHVGSLFMSRDMWEAIAHRWPDQNAKQTEEKGK